MAIPAPLPDPFPQGGRFGRTSGRFGADTWPISPESAADSGIRLNELLNIKSTHIDWETNTVMIWGKGGKQRKAPFTKRTVELLHQVLKVNRVSQVSQNVYINIWGMKRRGIQIMLYRLQEKTGLPCNPHTFRRTFASGLHRVGLDVEHIMRLGGWESLDMVLRYTRSVKFEESLRLYQVIMD